jgi:hypothetical protein
MLWGQQALRGAGAPDRRWLWHGYLLPGAVTLLTSQWKSGKTTLASILLSRPKGGGQLAGLRRLARQLRSKKVVVKLFLRHALHAKLYLLLRPDPISPKVGYLGNSNLTFAGLRGWAS